MACRSGHEQNTITGLIRELLHRIRSTRLTLCGRTDTFDPVSGFQPLRIQENKIAPVQRHTPRRRCRRRRRSIQARGRVLEPRRQSGPRHRQATPRRAALYADLEVPFLSVRWPLLPAANCRVARRLRSPKIRGRRECTSFRLFKSTVTKSSESGGGAIACGVIFDAELRGRHADSQVSVVLIVVVFEDDPISGAVTGLDDLWSAQRRPALRLQRLNVVSAVTTHDVGNLRCRLAVRVLVKRW